MPGAPRDRVCTANDYFWSSDARSTMWGRVGNNFANTAYGIGDTITATPFAQLFGASSLTELWRHALVPNIECYTPTNGFHTFASVWTGFAVAGVAAGFAGGTATTANGATRALPSSSEASALIQGAKPTGSALKLDTWHRAATFAADDIVESGTVFLTVGGDGTEWLLVQMPGQVNGIAGRFEWIVNGGSLTHQMFVRGDTINGIPIEP